MNEPQTKTITLGGDTDISVPQGGTVYTDSFQFGDVDTFAMSYLVACTGIPNLKIELEQSMEPPETENAADNNFAVPVPIADIETALTAKTIQHNHFMPLPLPYMRFKITEQTDTVVDTVINIWLHLQKKFRM